MYIKLGGTMKVIAFVFTALEALLLAGQMTTLVSTYWTSWDLRFNWTQTNGGMNRRPLADGQLLSQGHGGLWSRCVKVFSTDKNGDHPQISADQCLNNYDSKNASMPYTFGKVCKTATAALCVGQLAITLTIVVIVLMSVCRSRGRVTMTKISLLLLLLQGLILFLIPITYLSGNMSELIEQLSAAYGLLLIVALEAGYAHDLAFWLQVGLSAAWMSACGVYIVLYHRLNCRGREEIGRNGIKTSETAEMQPLSNEIPG